MKKILLVLLLVISFVSIGSVWAYDDIEIHELLITPQNQYIWCDRLYSSSTDDDNIFWVTTTVEFSRIQAGYYSDSVILYDTINDECADLKFTGIVLEELFSSGFVEYLDIDEKYVIVNLKAIWNDRGYGGSGGVFLDSVYTILLTDNINYEEIMVTNVGMKYITDRNAIVSSINYDIYNRDTIEALLNKLTKLSNDIDVFAGTGGYDQGYDNGYTVGLNEGRDTAYDDGFDMGYLNGYTAGVNVDESAAYNAGYNQGYADKFASGFDKWIVPAIATVIIVGGIMSVVAYKNRREDL